VLRSLGFVAMLEKLADEPRVRLLETEQRSHAFVEVCERAAKRVARFGHGRELAGRTSSAM
jgi:hypothetical protein